MSGLPTLPVIPTFDRPLRMGQGTLTQLFRLDGTERPGLTTTEFKNLLASCRCGLVMTRRAYRLHICQDAPVVIDLTADEDSDTLASSSGSEPDQS